MSVNYDILLGSFPKVSTAIAYGSGVFPQAGYEKEELHLLEKGKSKEDAPMIDLIFLVDNPSEWHRENLKLNPDHYSILRHFPDTITRMQESGAGIWYNTDVTIPNSRTDGSDTLIKYGVIDRNTFDRDLIEWTTLYMAGRMHKPVRIIDPEGNLNQNALIQNFRNGLTVALLRLGSSFTALELYTEIAKISYTGDFRMKFGENPHKITNIVNKQIARMHCIYSPLLLLDYSHIVSIFDPNERGCQLSCISPSPIPFLCAPNQDLSKYSPHPVIENSEDSAELQPEFKTPPGLSNYVALTETYESLANELVKSVRFQQDTSASAKAYLVHNLPENVKRTMLEQFELQLSPHQVSQGPYRPFFPLMSDCLDASRRKRYFHVQKILAEIAFGNSSRKGLLGGSISLLGALNGVSRAASGAVESLKGLELPFDVKLQYEIVSEKEDAKVENSANSEDFTAEPSTPGTSIESARIVSKSDPSSVCHSEILAEEVDKIFTPPPTSNEVDIIPMKSLSYNDIAEHMKTTGVYFYSPFKQKYSIDKNEINYPVEEDSDNARANPDKSVSPLTVRHLLYSMGLPRPLKTSVSNTERWIQMLEWYGIYHSEKLSMDQEGKDNKEALAFVKKQFNARTAFDARSVDIPRNFFDVHVNPAMEGIVAESSKSQALKGILTAGLAKSVVYGLRKVKKMLQAKK